MPKVKCLLSGASGFLGGYLCEALINDGYEVHALYEHSESFSKNPTVEHQYLVNLLDFENIDNVIEKIQPDFVIHLAAKTEVALSFDNYLQVSQVNYVGTVNLAEANRKYNPNLKLFLMASTNETYGQHDPKDGAFTEQTEQLPMAPYAVAKLACEYYLKYMGQAYKFPYCILRQTNAYGRTDNDFFAMERIVSQMLNSDECNLGEPTPIRNFIWVDDLINLYMTILNRPTIALGEVFVTGPDNGISISELADMVKNKLGWKGKVNWGTIPKRPGEIYYLNSDQKKARNMLGWEPKVSLSDGIDRLISIWRNQ